MELIKDQWLPGGGGGDELGRAQRIFKAMKLLYMMGEYCYMSVPT